MIKLFMTIAAAGLALGAAALPAQANTLSANTVSPVSCDTSYSVRHHEFGIEQGLKREGYNVSSVNDWNGCVQAFITKTDGSQTMAFFDPLTLKPVGPNAAKG
ncbi:PepSY domain-containing protein [Devosia neptuniae]|uniref:PepSY domain-containing protein n=1 Tax=Devosia neptuniae TaxID=191302 RepID=A0ABY6CKK3_9HYPH|nr:PepSY domain-containing protein [Devosia neptuniae]UXN70558.1 PepSY domain-containing protein [Devosia neptuniae]